MASGTRSRTVAQASLLRLPDYCLLAVMQHCADDPRTLLSAATAHSRLQQAAVEAFGSISAGQLDQEQADRLLRYLAKHGQHVRSLDLCASDDVQLLELPPSLTKLDSLHLEGMRLQLQPCSDGTQGALRAGLPLTRLELSECTLLDRLQGLAAALAQLPDLQHLSVDGVFDERLDATFPTTVLSRLTKLTSLKLQGVECQDRNSSSNPSAALQPLQALTRLADLQLGSPVLHFYYVTADTLSGAGQLTRLVLSGQLFEPRALAGKTLLQHLNLRNCSFVPGAGVAQLLPELQQLMQLTHLELMASCRQTDDLVGPSPPSAAYASLTASSRLQHLDFSHNTLPAAAWQYMCPPGRTLPQLQHLDIRWARQADGSPSLLKTSTIVSCCPGLQSLRSSMPCSTAQLAPLQRLTSLHTLTVGDGYDDVLQGVQALCQLTGLQDLELRVAWGAEVRLLQLTQLTRLTALTLANVGGADLRCNPQDPASEPVWRLLLRLLRNSHYPEVAQQAAAALEAA